MEATDDFSQSSASVESRPTAAHQKCLPHARGSSAPCYLHSPMTAPREALLYPYLASEETGTVGIHPEHAQGHRATSGRQNLIAED